MNNRNRDRPNHRRSLDDENYEPPRRNFGFAPPSGPQFENRNAGTAMWRMSIRQQRCSGSDIGPGQPVCALRITAKDRYSDRCWGWGERLDITLEWAADRSGGRWSGLMTPDIVRAGQNDKPV